MKETLILLLIFFVTQTVTCQETTDEKRIYDFFSNVILKNSGQGIILSEHGNGTYLFTYKDSVRFYPKGCLFKDEKYRDINFWDTIITKSDWDYIYAQIREHKNFRWNKEFLPADVEIISKRQAKSYSKKVIRNEKKLWKGKGEIIPIKSISTYSVPVFNIKGNFALIYNSIYSGPESGMLGIEIFLKIDGEWKGIGYDLIGML